MATKKRKSKPSLPARKRRSKPMYRAPKRRKRSKGFADNLSEAFSASTAKAGARVITAGAIGGFVAGGANKVLASQNTVTRYGIQAALSFVTYAVLGFPSMSAGMAGAFTALEMQGLYNKFLSDDENIEFADEESFNQLPEMIDEDGNVLSLQESSNGQLVYLNEGTGEVTLAEDVFLQDNVFLQDTSIYPQYAPQY